jgi:hypothetical protein
MWVSLDKVLTMLKDISHTYLPCQSTDHLSRRPRRRQQQQQEQHHQHQHQEEVQKNNKFHLQSSSQHSNAPDHGGTSMHRSEGTPNHYGQTAFEQSSPSSQSKMYAEEEEENVDGEYGEDEEYEEYDYCSSQNSQFGALSEQQEEQVEQIKGRWSRDRREVLDEGSLHERKEQQQKQQQRHEGLTQSPMIQSVGQGRREQTEKEERGAKKHPLERRAQPIDGSVSFSSVTAPATREDPDWIPSNPVTAKADLQTQAALETREHRRSSRRPKGVILRFNTAEWDAQKKYKKGGGQGTS